MVWEVLIHANFVKKNSNCNAVSFVHCDNFRLTRQGSIDFFEEACYTISNKRE